MSMMKLFMEASEENIAGAFPDNLLVTGCFVSPPLRQAARCIQRDALHSNRRQPRSTAKLKGAPLPTNLLFGRCGYSDDNNEDDKLTPEP
jgi:hypothetical protein